MLYKNSTIFRTINPDAKRLTEQFGLLGKSFRDIKKDFANGLGVKNSLFQTSISKSDWQSLQKFNSAIKVTNDGLTKSQRITKAWNENMTGCSMAAKRMGNDLITGKQKIGDISNSMKTATASTKALGVAMNIFANVGFMLAITAITKVVSELAQAQENAVQAAKEATEAYNDEISSIDDYKTRLSELHEELHSGNLSYEETKTKRTELMSIQDELIKKFGTEKGAIESITEAINGQVDALDTLNEKSYRDWVAKADEQTFWNKILPGGKSGLDQAIDYMETEKTVSFYDMQNANLPDELQAIQKEIDETIKSKYNLDKTFAMFNVTGRPDEIKEQLDNILQDYMDLSKVVFTEKGIDSSLWNDYRKEVVDSINEAKNEVDEGLKDHQETYQTYIEGLIKYDSEYSDEYANILQKRAELESAQNSGNKEEIQKARQAFMDAINKGIEESGSNENIRKYFESLYPELQAEFSDWAFEFDLQANVKGLKDIASEIGEQYTAIDLLDMVNTEGIQEGEESFNKLIDKAIEYGVCTDNSAKEVQKLIDLLVELGIVQDNVQGSTLNNKTDISSVQSQISSFTSAQEALNTALSEQSENGIITAETLQKLSNNYENLDSAIEMTTTGIRLNTSEMAKLNAEKKKAIKTELDKKEKELTDAYNKGSVELAVYQETLASCTDTKSEDYEILSNLIEQKKADQEATLGQIGELQKLSMEYQNAISTHNAFIKALSSADQGAGYDAIVSGIEKVKEVWKNGDYGKDELRAFVDYFTYADMSTASIEEIKNAYNDAVKAGDKYFTESVKGQQNFLYLLKETKVNGEALAKVDKKGNWTINIKDMDKAAEACGFSVDFLTDCLKKLEEKGFEGAFTDNNKLVDTYAQLQELDKQIETLEKRLANGDTTSGLKQQLDALVKERNKIHVELDRTDVKKAIEEILALQKTIKSTSDQGLISTLQNEQKSIAKKYGVDLEKVLGLDTTDAKSQWKLFSETIENADLKTDVVVSANTNPFDKTIKNLTEKEYTAKIGFKVETAGVVSKVSTVLKDIIATLNGNNKEDDGGGSGAYGSANVSGHSHANGSIGISKSQKNVMVSEVKPEMVVDPHNGKYTIYNRPTMLPELPKNAIVFNGDQTEEILKNGMTTSFGKAYVNGNVSGNAYVPGYGGKGKFPTGDNDSSKKKKKKTSSSKDKNTKKSKDAFSEVIDWIEIKLEKFAKNTEKLVKRIDKYISYINANKAVNTAMTAVKSEKNVNQQAYNRYMKQANSVGLSSAYKKKVQNGQINIQTIKDEKLKEKIDEYQKWYEKAQACKDTIAELNEQLTELAQKKLENITDWFDTRVNYKDARKNVYETSIAYREAQGKRGTDNQYKGLVDNNKSKQAVLQNEYKKTTEQLNALVKAGSIKKYSKEWYEWQEKLREIQANINDCKTETIDLKKQWLDAKLTAFDKAIEKCTDLQDELSDIIDLMNSDTFFNESGKLTEDGFTYIGMVGQQLASAKQEVLKYADEINYINEEYKKFKKGQNSLITSEDDYNNRIKEVTENQREAAKAVKDYRDALIDLKVKGIEAEIEALKELADKNKELLNEEKNRDDYEKSIQDKTKSIDILKRQIAELELSDNRKDKAELKKLKKQLADAQEELAQTEKDHNIEMQEKAIDDAANAYEEKRNNEIKEIQSSYEKQSAIIADYLDDVKDNYNNVFSDITEIAERFGVTLTSELKKPWQDAKSAIDEYKLASQELAELNKKASTTANTNTNTAIKNSINTIKNQNNATLVAAKRDDLFKKIENLQNLQNNPIVNGGLNTVNNVLKNLPNTKSSNNAIKIGTLMKIEGNTDERLLGQMKAMCDEVPRKLASEIKKM